MTNLKDLQAQLTKEQIIDAIKAKVLKGGNNGDNDDGEFVTKYDNCPPPYGNVGSIFCPPPYGNTKG